MTKGCKKTRRMSNQKKKIVYAFIILFIVAVVIGIKSAYAYYTSETPFSMLTALVGDFDSSGDINIVIWKQSSSGSKDYVKSYGAPSIGYTFMPGKTQCVNPVDQSSISCTNGSTGSCHYTYNSSTRDFSLTSNQKVTCNFYFDLTSSTDIDLYIMIQNNEVVDDTHDGKNYQLVNNIPASGYTYSTSSCDVAGGSVSYTSSSRVLTVSSTVKNKCYAYFDATSSINNNTQVFIQSAEGSKVYSLVDTIPVGKIYELNESKSRCVNNQNVETDSVITYDGTVNILNNNDSQNCDVYLDLK